MRDSAAARRVLVPGLLFMMLAQACGQPTKTIVTPKVDGKATAVRNYSPLAAKADVKAPNSAVIFGTTAKGESTTFSLPTAPSHSTVDALFVRTGDGTASGGMSPVKLETSPNPDGSVAVGVFEEFSGGTGSQWRASVWIAAFVAASTLNKDLTDFRFSATSGGHIDGASASALMTAAFLATMTGAKIDPKATMTGTINPDGTVGPVGGIPEKFAAAIEKGKTKIGFPVGLRNARSAATGKMVDLVEFAKSKGAVAIEITDAHQAYTLLTGQELPQTVAAATNDLILDPKTVERLKQQYEVWKKRTLDNWSDLVEIANAGRVSPTLLAIAVAAKENAEAAEEFFAQGAYAPAYSRIVQAWMAAASASSIYTIVKKMRASDAKGALVELGNLAALDEKASLTVSKIADEKPNSLGGHLRVMSAFQWSLAGWAFHIFAQEHIKAAQKALIAMGSSATPEVAQSPAFEDAVAAAVAPAVTSIGRAVGLTDYGISMLDVEQETTVNYMCSLPAVRRLANSFQSTAAATITYFEALLLEPLAKEASLPIEQARVRLALNEPDYLTALVSSRLRDNEGVQQKFREAWGENSLPWGLLNLSATQLAYAKSSAMIARHYSLGIHLSGDGSVDHPEAFAAVLTNAELSARRNATAAKIASGAIPVQAKVAYQRAVGLASRKGVVSQTAALEAFWLSSAFSQSAVMLARN